MLSSRCGSLAHVTQNVFVVNNNLGRIFTSLASRLYSKSKGDSCEDPAQTSGRTVEPWPRHSTPPPMWRCGCPQEPPPPNNDPYRIKVPEIVVPPLPPSNAKWSGVVFTSTEESAKKQQDGTTRQERIKKKQGAMPKTEQSQNILTTLKGFIGKWTGQKNQKMDILDEDSSGLFTYPNINCQFETGCGAETVQECFHNTSFVHPDYWKDKPAKKLAVVCKDVLPKLGYHGRTKYKYAFHEPWKPLDRISLLEQAEREDGGQLLVAGVEADTEAPKPNNQIA